LKAVLPAEYFADCGAIVPVELLALAETVAPSVRASAPAATAAARVRRPRFARRG
jgi:hypothetical protein